MRILGAALLTVVLMARAQGAVAGAPYMPSWQARHHLQLLVDHAGLALPVSHWPLPMEAVTQALASLPEVLPQAPADLDAARRWVLRELHQTQFEGRAQLDLRARVDAPAGFGEDFTPGSSAQFASPVLIGQDGDLSFAARVGVRVNQTSNSLRSTASGWGRDAAAQASLDGSAFVLASQAWQLQAFSHRHWWGPGWQSSLVNGSNSPAWNGLGIQRSSVRPSDHAWLSWMGPWNVEVFLARAQDPRVASVQPQGFLYSGMRLTMRPQRWMELGLSRGLQTGGAGRPGGLKNFVKSFFGQEVNRDPGDPVDSSSQIAGYDLRLRCPPSWGQCAAYTQWMGEDAAGQVPLPYKFMSLWGFEQTLGKGRYRWFVEYVNTNANSLPWDREDQEFAGYLNSVYTQGYTNGARWVGSSFGGGSQVGTLGWLDVQTGRVLKLHVGNLGLSLGSYDPSQHAPHGRLLALAASQTLGQHQGLSWTPELAWLRLSQGHAQGANKRQAWRLGLRVQAHW